MRRCLLTLCLCLLAAPADAQTITSRSWSDPRPGVRILEGRTSGPTTRFYAAFVDLCADYVHVDATARPTSRRSASSWGSAVGATVATNGDFFLYESPPRVYGQAVGGGRAWPVAQTGESADAAGQWYHRRYGWIAFGDGWVDFNHTRWVKNNRSPRAGFMPSTVTGAVPPGTNALVSGFPELVTEGARYTCASPTASGCFPDRTDMRQRHPRTAMGLTEDMQTFILLVVDGRSSSSAGMYGTELASLIHQLGAWQAFNLDGGGSSQMWVDGRGTINSPSDGTPRSVANHWGIFAGAATGLPRAPGSCVAEVDECFRRSDGGEGCEVEQAMFDLSVVGGDTTSDVDGDGLADACIRSGSDLRCRLSNAESWGDFHFRNDAFGDEFEDMTRWSTIRMGDVNGDGLADVCGRFSGGVRCWPSTPDGVGAPIDGPPLADDGGWRGPAYGSTLRVADFDGDGLDDLCVRRSTELRCYRSTGDAFEEPVLGPAWSDADGFDQPAQYATLRFGDLDGDGRADVCARRASGMECHLSTGDGFGPAIEGPTWSDRRGFDHVRYWSTIRMADVDGDGRADLCVRTSTDLRCHFFDGVAFGDAVIVADLADDRGWADHDNYATIRTGDVDGDGADELCARANAGVRCWRWDGAAFARFWGPELSDDDGWDDPKYYLTLRLADVNGDRRADLCARAAAGLRCWPSTGAGFGPPIGVDGYDDGRGFDLPSRYAAFTVAGPRCMPVEETCNGLDDDCDGEIDEGACAPPDAGVTRDAGATGRDASATADAGPTAGDGGTDAPLSGGCGCRSAPGGATPLGSLALLALAFLRRRGGTPRGA
ncbi:MAG: phosphodiester glycosidase family protein [Myxococcota bacterium]|nr:phosphodiester glycosidase family protein [Myxococcota bacterium]